MDALAVTRESLEWARFALVAAMDNEGSDSIGRIHKKRYERSLREVDTVLDDTLTGLIWWGMSRRTSNDYHNVP